MKHTTERPTKEQIERELGKLGPDNPLYIEHRAMQRDIESLADWEALYMESPSKYADMKANATEIAMLRAENKALKLRVSPVLPRLLRESWKAAKAAALAEWKRYR